MTSEIEIEIDFNNLFNLNLSYSFDVLKKVLVEFVKDQKVTKTKLHELENEIKALSIENM